MSVVHEQLAEIEVKVKAAGHEFEVGTSPVFEAVVAKMAVNAQHNARMGLLPQVETEADKHSRFLQAARAFLGCKPPADLGERTGAGVKTVRGFLSAPVDLPDSFDLREFGVVTEVRDQASCGSCYDFSAIFLVEAEVLGALGQTLGLDPKTFDLSEQEFLNCSQDGGGCNGDWPESVLKFAMERGIPAESDVSYKAVSGSGRCWNGKVFKIDGYEYIARPDAVADAQAIKTAMFVHKRPVSVAVAVDNVWMAYKSGVYNGQPNDNGINHAIDLIGWGKDAGGEFWLARNHWNKSWGEAGYMRTRFGANSIGFGASRAWINAPVPPVPPVPPSPPNPPVPPPAPPKPAVGTLDAHLNLFTGKIGGTVTFPGGVSLNLSAPQWHFPGLDDIKGMVDDGIAFLKSDPVLSAEAAAAKVVADAKAGNYGAVLADVLASVPVAMTVESAVVALLQKWKHAFGLQAARGGCGCESPVVGFSPADLLAWTQAIAAIIAAFHQLFPKK